jgi:GT2 family glycosyltransferase
VDLTIVVVSWNTRDLLLACLASIERALLHRPEGPPFAIETLVVDNASADGSAAAARARFSWAEVVSLPENLGFSGGCNVGLRRSKGRHVLLLNSDTVVLAGAVERCVGYLDAHADVGVVGPQLLHPDGRLQNSIHAHPRLLTELVPKGLLETLFPRRFPSKRYRHAGPIDVPAVLGAAFFVRRAVLEKVGLLPEDYFLFLEETDYCLRVLRAGYRVVHVPDARIVHVFGASSKKRLPAETRIEYQRSLLLFFRKHRGPLSTALLLVLRTAKALLYVVVRAPGALFSARLRERWRQDRTVLAWYLRGRPADWGIPGRRRPEGGDPVPGLGGGT